MAEFAPIVEQAGVQGQDSKDIQLDAQPEYRAGDAEDFAGDQDEGVPST